MSVKSLKISAQVHADRFGYYAWSFWCAPGRTADDIARAAKFDNDHIRESRVGSMQKAGFTVLPDSDDDDHCKVVLGDAAPSSAVCNKLRAVFDPARPRPE